MSCDARDLLNESVISATHHLEHRLREPEGSDVRFEHGELKRLAQELVDALNELREHEEKHRCA